MIHTRIRTGYIPQRAAATLGQCGMPPAQATAAIQAAACRHFPRFAASWDRYLSGKGVVCELLAMPPAQRDALLHAAELGDACAPLTRASTGTGSPSPGDIAEWAGLAGRFRDRTDRGIAFQVLVNHHGMSPPLARAVLAYNERIPGWVLLVLPAIAGATWSLLAFAVLNPTAAFFQTEDFDRAGPVHILALAGFGLFFVAAWVILLRRRPAHDRAWRSALARLTTDGGAESGSP